MNLPKLSAAEFAALCGVSRATVTNWMDEGMPCERTGRQRVRVEIDPALAVPWVVDRREPAGSQRERLAKEQADKIAMQNEAQRGRLIDVALVEETLMGLAAHIAQAHDALPGRLAHELAGISDPGLIRAKLLAEMREIRDGASQFGVRTAGALERMAEDVGRGEGTTESDGEPVGGPDEVPAGRKRRTRKVAK